MTILSQRDYSYLYGGYDPNRIPDPLWGSPWMVGIVVSLIIAAVTIWSCI